MSKQDWMNKEREQAEAEGKKVYTPEPITAEEMEALLREQDDAERGASTVYDYVFRDVEAHELWERYRARMEGRSPFWSEEERTLLIGPIE